jgi:hypothetical protein
VWSGSDSEQPMPSRNFNATILNRWRSMLAPLQRTAAHQSLHLAEMGRSVLRPYAIRLRLIYGDY